MTAKVTTRKKIGAPRKPVPENLEQIEALAQYGLTEDEIASVLGTCRATINAWKKRSPEFDQALKRGKAKADLTVTKSLFERATQEHDTTAMIFWLKNRQPERWRDRREMGLTGGGNGDDGIQVQLTVVHTKADQPAPAEEKPEAK